MQRDWRLLQMKTRKDREYFRHKNYAHRGLHDIKKGIPENSLAAFEAAVENGYGVELDVQLSKDGQVVVFHDVELERACGVPGGVADYDYEEIRKFRLFGTDQKIPLFSEVLAVLEKGPVDLVCEIKPRFRIKELCSKTLALLRKFKGRFCVESFDPRITRWFKRKAPDIVRGLLAQTRDAYDHIPDFFKGFLSNCRLAWYCKPDFIAYENKERPERVLRKCREKGTMLVAWTSRVPDVDQAHNDAVIFEGYRPNPTY